MKLDEIKYLASPEGAELLERYANLKEKDLFSLALKLGKAEQQYAAALVNLLKTRQKAKNKFSRWDKMFFTPLGFEQSTGELIAEWVSRRFENIGLTVDLTSGIGGNAIFLAKKNKVIAIDSDEATLECAKLNANVYGVDQNIDFKLGMAEDNVLPETKAFFIDPARDRVGKTKTRSILNSRPDLLELMPKMFAVTENIAVKISPAFDYAELEKLPKKPEVEVISENNEVKVVILWFGGFKTCERRATCFVGGEVKTFTDCEVEIKTSEMVNEFIYEPNKAIIKARLLDEIGSIYGLKKIDTRIAYLTSDELINVDRQFFRIFRVIETGKFSLKSLKKRLKELDINQAKISVRGFPILPEELLNKLSLKEGGEKCLLFTTKGKERIYILCDCL